MTVDGGDRDTKLNARPQGAPETYQVRRCAERRIESRV